MSGGGAAEAPGREEGARAGSCSESFGQRVSGASRHRQQGAAADAPERLTGEAARGGEDESLMPRYLHLLKIYSESVPWKSITKRSLCGFCLCLSG